MDSKVLPFNLEEKKDPNYLEKQNNLPDPSKELNTSLDQWTGLKLTGNEFEDLKYRPNWFTNSVEKITNFLNQYWKIINEFSIIFITFLLLYLAAFIWFIICKSRKANSFQLESNIKFLVITAIFAVYLLWKVVRKQFSDLNFQKCQESFTAWRYNKILKIMVVVTVFLLISIYIIYIAVKYGALNLRPLAGIAATFIFGFLISEAPHRLRSRPIINGILLQFAFGILVLRTQAGYSVFSYLGDTVVDFLRHIDAGAAFLFGDFTKHYFAFRILPVIAYIYCTTYVLYYYRILQHIIIFISIIMEFVMGTTAGESMSAAANIFIGMIESPLLIKPFIGIMTNSELFAIMTGGFATIAGTVLSAFIMFGVPANHLMTASIMGAPGGLVMSKLIYPETKMSLTTSSDVRRIPESPYHNVVEAISQGASDSVGLIASVGMNIFIFICILSLLNSVLKWIGKVLCITHNLSFEFICSYLFWPIAFLIGIDTKDCFKVAELFGIKIFLNEFIAFQKLGKLIDNKALYDKVNWTVTKMLEVDNDIILIGQTNITLVNGILTSKRSVVITTYLLCGFGNFGSVGMLLGALINMAPHRSKDISTIILRALIAGNMVSILTSCTAGILFTENI